MVPIEEREQFMADDLKAIRETWEKRAAAGPASSDPKGVSLADDDKVRKLADKYITAHKDDFAGWEKLSLEVLVRQLEDYRDRGESEEAEKVQVWLWHRFEPQNIGGTYEATVRVG